MSKSRIMIKKARWAVGEVKLRLKYMTTKDCIFCKIISGEIGTSKVAETDKTLGILDINPVADTHILIFPKRHIDSVLTVKEGDGEALEDMFFVAKILVADKKLDAFRLVFNGGRNQHVPHLHMHLVSGSTIKWSKL